MHNYGFVRVAAASPIINVSDCNYNSNQIIKLIDEAYKNEVEIIVFPELCLTGYTCGDLFLQKIILDGAENEIKNICSYTEDKDMLIVVGAPIKALNTIFNCAIVINKGSIIGIVPKTYLPNYGEFYEKRWFSSAKNITANKEIVYGGQKTLFGPNILFEHKKFKEVKIGIEICEDLWVPIPPSCSHSLNGATIILNPSASDDLVGKSDYRSLLVNQQSARCIAGYVYSSAGYGESSTDVVYSGHCMISENGVLISQSERFELKPRIIYSDIDVSRLIHDRIKNNSFYDNSFSSSNEYSIVSFDTSSRNKDIVRDIHPFPFVPSDKDNRNMRCKEIFNIQTTGLVKRIQHIGVKSLVIGISGGLDSTLALLVCAKACDRLNIDRNMITAITMPGFGTTDRTYNNAIELMQNLGVKIREISIKDACIKHFEDINHDIQKHDITYENTQARERTQILMDIANQENGIVVGTGDLSELALGWATYNGDHMSMYGVNVGVPKTLVRYLVKWIADYSIEEGAKNTLYDILDTPVSPELLPPDDAGNISQKTEEVVGPYELHDFFLYYALRYGFSPKKVYFLATRAFNDKYEITIIYKWLKKFYWRFISQQFKRSCLPDGPKVGSICLSPRGDWRMPSDASAEMWLKEIESMNPES